MRLGIFGGFGRLAALTYYELPARVSEATSTKYGLNVKARSQLHRKRPWAESSSRNRLAFQCLWGVLCVFAVFAVRTRRKELQAQVPRGSHQYSRSAQGTWALVEAAV